MRYLVERDRRARRLMHIIHAIVQLSASQCGDKCRVILERASDCAPNRFWLGAIFPELRNQHVIRVRDSAALILHDVILAAHCCPNQAFARKSGIDDGISCVPFLSRLCKLAVAPSQRARTVSGKSLVECTSWKRDVFSNALRSSADSFVTSPQHKPYVETAQSR